MHVVHKILNFPYIPSFLITSRIFVVKVVRRICRVMLSKTLHPIINLYLRDNTSWVFNSWFCVIVTY